MPLSLGGRMGSAQESLLVRIGKRFWRDPSIRQCNKAAREIIEKFTIALTY
jgi:hypothetical protein